MSHSTMACSATHCSAKLAASQARPKTAMKPSLYLSVLLLVCSHGFGATTFDETLVDRDGYPLDDPQYDDIRMWHEAEENGIRQYRSGSYEGVYDKLAVPAQHGFKRAQHTLALMHINGTGADKNVLVGIALLGLAAETGDRKLKREYNKAVKALPKKYQPLVRDQTAYYITRYGMKAQGISCRAIKRTGSNLKQLRCSKQPGNYKVWDWAP